MAIGILPHYRRPKPIPARAGGRFRRCSAALIAIAVAIIALASPHSAGAASVPDDSLVVSILSIGPGEEVYERFGHNAIWIHPRDIAYKRIDQRLTVPTGESPTYNYGVFNFNEQNFIWRFLRGRMDYWMEAPPISETMAIYVNADRAIWVQDLDFSPAQVRKLLEILDSQEGKEHKYRYDYYTANCSTKLRDALDAALGGQVRAQLAGRPSAVTYRSETRRLMQYSVPLYTGLNFALAHAADRPISAWDECFLPLKLRDYLRDLTVEDEAGQKHALVKSAAQLYHAGRPAEPNDAPNWSAGYFLAGEHLALAMLLLAWFARRHWSLRLALAALAGAWAFLVAFGGTFALFVWLFTSHVAAYNNENILLFSPLMVPLIVLGPGLAIGKKWGGRYTLWLAAAVAGSATLGLVLKALPWFYQDNWELIALALPANLGLAGAIYILSRPKPAVQPVKPDAPAAATPQHRRRGREDARSR